MRITSELTIHQQRKSRADEVPVSEIFLNGKSTQQFVSGAVLEAAVQWENYFLLFVTDDVPYEEMLRVVLLEQQLTVVDSARIGGPYSTGSFSALNLREPNCVEFRFIGDTVWRIELLQRARLRVPFFSEPAGVNRALGFSRHFIVHGNSRPQDALQRAGNGGK